ncbi:unnamed protein product [Moneuplotes crassus]|uniref:Uncharacterized protein n=1 Tax=Euplotes crassus TaxID=5936 RepID=A0AAD1U810_EUPCR|nr:unnamed protein product [Moneuplotes crassus]
MKYKRDKAWGFIIFLISPLEDNKLKIQELAYLLKYRQWRKRCLRVTTFGI